MSCTGLDVIVGKEVLQPVGLDCLCKGNCPRILDAVRIEIQDSEVGSGQEATSNSECSSITDTYSNNECHYLHQPRYTVVGQLENTEATVRCQGIPKCLSTRLGDSVPGQIKLLQRCLSVKIHCRVTALLPWLLVSMVPNLIAPKSPNRLPATRSLCTLVLSCPTSQNL